MCGGWLTRGLFTAMLACWTVWAVSAGEKKMDKKKGMEKTAIVLASFGTTYPKAIKAITNIESRVKKAFPGAEVRIAFTSNIIRKIWMKRASDAKFLAEYPGLKRFVTVKTPLATIADLQNEGYKNIIVQPTHIYAGEEFSDTRTMVAALNMIKTIKPRFTPFHKLLLGRPALGKPGISPDYHEDIAKAVKTLAGDVDMARKENASLVYMGHGNEYYSTGIYAEFEKAMRKAYPDVKIYVGTVEGYPSLGDVVERLKHAKPARVLLKPMMIVAGDHANNDMAGDEPDSWKSEIEKLGVKVFPKLEGLGENDQWADIFVEHIKDVAGKNGLKL